MDRSSQTTIIKADMFNPSGRLVCRCREPARRFVSRKAESEGRAFWKCAKFQDEPGCCRFWSWEDALNPPVTKDGYKTTNAVDAEGPQGSSPQPQPQSPQKSVGREMASPSVRATQTNGGDGHTPGLSTPSASSSRATQAMTPTTPSNPSRSRFMKSNSTPEATAAALAKRKQLIESTIAKNKADAAAAVSTSSTSSSQPQPPGSKSGGGFTPKPSTPIVRQSYTNNDTTSMDFDNDVDMDLGSNRGDTTPIRSRISETRTLPKGDEGQHGISIDEGGSPRKRARGSEPGVRWDDTQEDNPFAGQRARPLFLEYGHISKQDSPSRGSTAQVDEILSRPADASSGPSTSRATTSMGPPPTTPGGPKTPSSTNTTTESHIMNLESLTEHLRLLERRRVAAERQSEIRQKKIGELEEENRELKLEVERLKLERDEQHAKLERDEGRITELLLEIRRLKGKST